MFSARPAAAIDPSSAIPSSMSALPGPSARPPSKIRRSRIGEADFDVAIASTRQALVDRERRACAIERVEMDAGRAAVDQLAAQASDDIGTEFADRVGIVAERFETFRDPA